MKLFLLTVALATSAAAFAQDASSSASVNASANSSELKAGDLIPSSTKREDIDEEITNARLRATTGAKSIWSLQSSFNYNGGSIEKPLASERPQLSPGTIENDPTKITGQVSIKARLTDHDNLNLGLGVGWLTPGQSGQKGQSEDPYINYSRVFKAGAVQNVLNVGVMKYTADSAVAGKLNYESDLDYTALVDVGTSKWQVGATAAWYREFYSAQVDGTQDQLCLFPFAEYSFTDQISFRTVYRGLTYYNSQDAEMSWVHDTATQSAGIGISITRDIYLYPNVQWVWEDIRADKTNVALSANINM